MPVSPFSILVLHEIVAEESLTPLCLGAFVTFKTYLLS